MKATAEWNEFHPLPNYARNLNPFRILPGHSHNDDDDRDGGDEDGDDLLREIIITCTINYVDP